MKWFKHDASAHIDAKIKKVKHKYGITGYGLYWYCIELIALDVDSKNISFVLEEDSETIAIEWNLDQLKVQEIMGYMVSLGLFENDSDGRITCLKLAKRLDDTNSKNPEIKKILNGISHNKSEKLGETPNNSESVEADKIRLEEIRLEEIKKEKKSPSRFTPPTLKEVISYCRERQNTVQANKFLNHYEANGWMRGKSKIKDWKACVRTWEEKENNDQPQSPTPSARRTMAKAGIEE